MKLFRNTTAVLVLTLFTGLAVFTTIQLGGRLFGASTANAQTVAIQAATGQAQDSSDDAQSADDYYGGSGGNGYGNGYGQSYSDPYSYGGSGGAGSSDGTTQTCPATGCSASSCHATQ